MRRFLSLGLSFKESNTPPNHHPRKIQGNNTLAGDIMLINDIRFINTILRHVKVMTAEHISNTEASTLQESARQVKQSYMQRGLNIINILMNGRFTCIRGNLVELQINLEICSNDEHVGEIERLNPTFKEIVRGIYNNLPF